MTVCKMVSLIAIEFIDLSKWLKKYFSAISRHLLFPMVVNFPVKVYDRG